MKILIINGPNLNLLGQRETHIYGNQSFDAFLVELKKEFSGDTIEYFQSNHEGEILDMLQKANNGYDGIVLNAAGLTHTSIALADTIAAINTPVVEVHISNIYAREEFRRNSYISAKCQGTITGCGLIGYLLAIEYFKRKNK